MGIEDIKKKSEEDEDIVVVPSKSVVDKSIESDSDGEIVCLAPDDVISSFKSHNIEPPQNKNVSPKTGHGDSREEAFLNVRSEKEKSSLNKQKSNSRNTLTGLTIDTNKMSDNQKLLEIGDKNDEVKEHKQDD